MDELTAALLAVADDAMALDALTDLADAGDVEAVADGDTDAG